MLLGLGAAAKVFPLLLVIPFVAGRFRGKEPDRGIRLAWAAIGAWVAVNLPFALAAPLGWWEFFRYNAARLADWDSLWYLACERTTGQTCVNTRLVNVASIGLFVGWVAVVWVLKARREPGFPRWTLGFPILVIFLLTNKVYSPQFSLWLLPWFALAFPRLGWFVAFEIADVAVFVTRFSWFGRYIGTRRRVRGAAGRRLRDRGRGPRAHPGLVRDRMDPRTVARVPSLAARRTVGSIPATAEVLIVSRPARCARTVGSAPRRRRDPGRDNHGVRCPHRTSRTIGIGAVFLLLAGTLAVGFAIKAPCVLRDWSDGRPFTSAAHTDHRPVCRERAADGDRLPYLDPCQGEPRTARVTSTPCSRCG